MEVPASDRRGVRLVVALAFVAVLAPLPASGQAETPDPKPEGVWLAGDLHVHTCYSHDAWCPPDDDNTGPDEFYTLAHTVEEQFCNASRRDLDYLAITDHNDVRSVTDPGFGACGVLPIRGYEASYKGHAQILGAGEVLDAGDEKAERIHAVAQQVRAKGGIFQVNHPANGSTDFPDDADWEYLYEVVPDTVEVWNISTLWQPPMPSGSSNDDAIRYWEGWLDRGERVGATGGSDNHWRSTAAVQGVGQPTTWVFAEDRTEAAILEGLADGRTSVSWQPPAHQGPRIYLEADRQGDGVYEAMVGDTVQAGAPMRVRVVGAPGSLLRVHTTGGEEAFPPVPVIGAEFEHRFAVPDGATWVRAEIVEPDGQDERRTVCDPLVGGETTYCRNQLLRLGMTSAIYVEQKVHDGPVYATIEDGRIVLGNALAERAWSTDPLRTEYMLDKRTGLRTGDAQDFAVLLDSAVLTPEDFSVERATTSSLPGGGLALTMELAAEPPSATRVIRTVKMYPGIAGFEVRTSIQAAGTLNGYALDTVSLPGAASEIHAFRGGYDWRGSDTPDWEPTVSPFGGHHSGDHRVTSTSPAGGSQGGEGEWLSIEAPSSARTFLVLERVDYASSFMQYNGGTGRARAWVLPGYDVAYLGPFESDVHVGHPAPTATSGGRERVLSPDRPLQLEPVFTGFGIDADDEVWQHHKYLEARSSDWERAVVFNSNGVDANRISTGAKDDMDLSEVQRQAEVARRMGIETFVLDDGWQAISGDWCPDSPECPEPRWDGSETSKFKPRFPDASFEAVREAIAPMELGLWMSPMMFNPESQAHADNPTWTCDPVAKALLAYNRADPNSGSNEAGIVPWNPEALGPHGKAIDYIEGRIRRAIEQWGVRYFKFDFMVWIDCAGVDAVTLYEYRESFIRMLDRLIADHPAVTFQIDETNDYRLFPFESTYRGPSWYANGHPKAKEALHNLWVLAPYVPGYTIGQAALGQRDDPKLSADYLMAVALGSHMTFFTDLTKLTPEQVETAGRWTDIYKENRDRFATFTYPLLEDPLPGNNWTGLQPWNPETGKGALLVFRQDSADETRTVPLRGIRGEGSFLLTDSETGEAFGEFTADQLRSGIPISLPERHTARVLLIDPAG